jgi:Protein of unknown function (DUF1573)
MRMAVVFVAAACVAEVRAEIIFEKPRFDFGVVKAAGAVEHRFAFKVTGERAAVIADIRASCGCVRSPLSKKVFRPGETGVVPLVVHVASQAEGKKRFELTLTVRDPVERIVTLTAEADIQSDVRIEPSNLVVQLHDGQSSTHRFTIRDRRPRPLQVKSAMASNPAMKATLLPVGKDAHERIVEVTIAAGLAAGRYNERLEIRAETTENPAFPENVVLEIPINVLRPSTYTLLPERVRVKRSDLAEGRVSRTATMIDRSGSSPEVRVEVGDPKIEATVRRESIAIVKLKVAVHPGASSTTARVLINGKPAVSLPIDVVD